MNTSLSYLNYLQSHLGVDHLILPEKTPLLHFHCFSSGDFTQEEQELFEKIMVALKLTPGMYVQTIGKYPVSSELKAPHVIVFGGEQDALGKWHDTGLSQRQLQTHSLDQMLKDPKYKKECWHHLSAVLALIH